MAARSKDREALSERALTDAEGRASTAMAPFSRGDPRRAAAPGPGSSPFSGEREKKRPTWRALTLVPEAPAHALAVQPHGLLLVVEASTSRIRQVSRNCLSLLGCPPEALLGKRLDDVVASQGCRILVEALARREQETTVVDLEMLDGAGDFEAVARGVGKGWLIELEPLSSLYRPPLSILGVRLRESLARLRGAASIAAVTETTVREIRRLTRLDRVIVVGVESGAFQVIAESRDADVASLMGARFAADDLPHRARALEPHGLFRCVVDVAEEPVGLAPEHDLGVTAIGLEPVSSSHRAFLAALGIRTSMSIAIVVEGRVWGFVIGHHLREPRRLAYDIRNACELIGQVVAGQLEGLTRAGERRAEARAFHAIGKIVARAGGYRHDWMGLASQADLLGELLAADGVAVVVDDGPLRLSGKTPDAEAVRQLDEVLRPRLLETPLVALENTAQLPELWSLAASVGVLGVRVRAERPYSLFWFREEQRDRLRTADNHRLSEPAPESPRPVTRPWTRVERRAARELGSRLAERSSTLLDEVGALNRELEAANAVRDEFLSALSHELRTPLNTIVGWAEMLAAGQLDAGQSSRAIEVIQRNSEALRRQVDDLLDVSRILRDKLRLEVFRFDLGELVAGLIADFGERARSKGVDIELSTDPNTRFVVADRERIAQSLWNVIDNALKFTDEGFVRVTVTREGNDIRIAVEDSGAGIDPELLPLVFDRFRQDRGTSRGARRGLGLGLALVRMLVEMHGGRVAAESGGRGKGATFFLWLPAAPSPPVAPVRPSEPGQPAPGHIEVSQADAEVSLEGIHLLVVEDDADSAELVANALRLRGAEVVLAYDAEEALERISLRPTAVISDIDLPKMNGYELIKAIRSSEYAYLPAIALSAFTSRRHRARALSAGFDAYFSKPADIGALARVISAMAQEPQ